MIDLKVDKRIKKPCFCEKTEEICMFLDIEGFEKGGYCTADIGIVSEEEIKEGCYSFKKY